MVKKIITIISILLLTGCSNTNVEVIPPLVEYPDEAIPDSPSLPELPELPDSSDVIFNSYHELLLSYVFIDVTNLSTIYLPTSIQNEKITWKHLSDDITLLKGNNMVYYISAHIGNQSRNFNITFENGVVKEIYQQDMKFFYYFVTNSNKLGTSMNPSKIVLHNTANTAAALNEVLYLNSSSNTSSTSYHYAVDDIGIYQAVRTNIYAHHAGDLVVNKQSIGIEIAKSMITDNTIKDKAIYNAQRLVRLLQMQYEIDDVITHQDVTGKYCPHDILDRYGINTFYNELKSMYTIV